MSVRAIAMAAAQVAGGGASSASYVDDVFATTTYNVVLNNSQPIDTGVNLSKGDPYWSQTVLLFKMDGANTGSGTRKLNAKTGNTLATSGTAFTISNGDSFGLFAGYVMQGSSGGATTSRIRTVDVLSDAGVTMPNWNQPWCVEGWVHTSTGEDGTTAEVSQTDCYLLTAGSGALNTINFKATGYGGIWCDVRLEIVRNGVGTTIVYSATDGAAHFVKAVYDGDKYYLYVDGMLRATSDSWGTWTTQPASLLTLHIDSFGSGTAGTGISATGFLQDIRWTVGTTRPTELTNVPTEPFPRGELSTGGMVWFKERGNPASHCLIDSVRPFNSSRLVKYLSSDSTASETASLGFCEFTNTGVLLSSSTVDAPHKAGASMVAWSFKKAAKFFDVVTYTGDGVAGRTIPHSLGVAPGMIVVKKLNATSDWQVYHRGNTAPAKNNRLVLNSTSASVGTFAVWADTDPTNTVFSVGSYADVNAVGSTYVAYLFAHDPDTVNGIIQCGSFTTDGSGNASVTLGWEPQYVLFKNSTGTAADWRIIDNIRGMPVGSGDAVLYPNLTSAETSAGNIDPTATGFNFSLTASTTYIYLAIRRPNKPPTTGTQVFDVQTASVASEGNQMNPATFSMTPDLFVTLARTLSTGSPLGAFWMDRLRGNKEAILSASTAAARTTPASGAGAISTYVKFDAMNTYNLAPTNSAGNNSNAAWAFRRAPGVFDVVCYTGTSANALVSHSLGVTPELVIIKSRSNSKNWPVWASALTNSEILFLNSTAAKATSSDSWNAAHTATSISLGVSGTNGDTNFSGLTYVAYLFATKAGISKVGSYTGNGGTQTINCGFTTGARFVLIKRTDSFGDWYVFDTARGIVAAGDPYLALNTTAGEGAGFDILDPDPSGFIVNQETTNNLNLSTATYIYLAFA